MYDFLASTETFFIALAFTILIALTAVIEEPERDERDAKVKSRDKRILGGDDPISAVRISIWPRIWLYAQIIAVIFTIALGILQTGIYFGLLPESMASNG